MVVAQLGAVLVMVVMMIVVIMMIVVTLVALFSHMINNIKMLISHYQAGQIQTEKMPL
jgi:non-ribosomal peptide synthetase component E (peptide arylation enzyme)